MNCPICFSENTKEYLRAYDDRYGYPGEYRLSRCLNCSHIFLDERFDAEETGRMYSNFYPRSSYAIESHTPHKEVGGFFSWLNGDKRSAYAHVPKNVCVLDIGCGFGESLGYHKNRGCEAHGCEADENIKRVADRYGYNVCVGLFSPNNYKEKYFDYVTMDQVLEHVDDVHKTLEGVGSVLKDRGVLIVSFPNASSLQAKMFGKKWLNWHIPYHRHFFSKESFKIAASKSGFKVEKRLNIAPSNWMFYQFLHLSTYPKNNEKSFFWSGQKDKLSIIQKALCGFALILHTLKITHLLTRFLDTLGMGDNTLVILRKDS